jgi:hypothetical protein
MGAVRTRAGGFRRARMAGVTVDPEPEYRQYATKCLAHTPARAGPLRRAASSCYSS